MAWSPMSTDHSWLALRLEGPLQSWGFDSQYNRRSTSLLPTKSAIAGICCAALGADRGSEDERRLLEQFHPLRMTAIAIPRRLRDRALEVRRVQDYHTIQGTRKADGGLKDCHITQRHYLADAAFGVLLFGPSGFLASLAEGLRDPRWGVWLGRKACIPTAPILVGVYKVRDEALKVILEGQTLEMFTRQEDVEEFSEGRDSLPDQALSFHSSRRNFAPRRVRTIQGLR